MFDGRKLGDLPLNHMMSEPGSGAHFGGVWWRLQFHAIIQHSGVSLSSTGTCGRKHPRANWCQLLIWLCSTLYSEVHLWGRADRWSAPIMAAFILFLKNSLRSGNLCAKFLCDCGCVLWSVIEGRLGVFFVNATHSLLQSSSSWHDAMA